MGILNNILEQKKNWLQENEAFCLDAKKNVQEKPLISSGFKTRLCRTASSKRNAVIAEFKRRSPSQGDLNVTFETVCQAYIKHQVTAISILTDTHFFGGSFQDIQSFKALSTDIPVLCKDFIIHPHQIWCAKSYGADAILLIADILKQSELQELYTLACSLKMNVLIELFDPALMSGVLALQPTLVGINSRNLDTLSVDLDRIAQTAKLLDKNILVVAESGISSRKDMLMFNDIGIYTFLIGHAFLQAHNLDKKLEELMA